MLRWLLPEILRWLLPEMLRWLLPEMLRWLLPEMLRWLLPEMLRWLLPEMLRWLLPEMLRWLLPEMLRWLLPEMLRWLLPEMLRWLLPEMLRWLLPEIDCTDWSLSLAAAGAMSDATGSNNASPALKSFIMNVFPICPPVRFLLFLCVTSVVVLVLERKLLINVVIDSDASHNLLAPPSILGRFATTDSAFLHREPVI